MKTEFLILLIALIIPGIGCDKDTNNFDLNKDPLRGVIGGKEWEYTVGNGEYLISANRITGLIMNEDLQDPCVKKLSSLSHLSVRFPPVRASYNLPFIGNDGYIVFSLAGGSTKYTATSGFIEVVEVSSHAVIGYISADFDDNNHVQGSFLLEICN